MSNKLVEKLSEEKFAGKNPEWKEEEWAGIKVLCAGDNENWYYKNRDVIYVQAKEDLSQDEKNFIAHCYGCGAKIKFRAQMQSKGSEQSDGRVGDESVKLEYIPYCPNCEKESKEIREGIKFPF